MGVCRFLKKQKYIYISSGLARKCEFGKALFSESKTVLRKAVNKNLIKRKALFWFVVVSSPQCGENTAFFSGFSLGGIHG
ncbi:hypothetical protein [Bilophila sp.]|uniref:hypothetical protein n=1 Tax=Bilophila sp. TaxID=1929485 RepID=UPI003076A61B